MLLIIAAQEAVLDEGTRSLAMRTGSNSPHGCFDRSRVGTPLASCPGCPLPLKSRAPKKPAGRKCPTAGRLYYLTD
jgi:hypothetical protein